MPRQHRCRAVQDAADAKIALLERSQGGSHLGHGGMSSSFLFYSPLSHAAPNGFTGPDGRDPASGRTPGYSEDGGGCVQKPAFSMREGGRISEQMGGRLTSSVENRRNLLDVDAFLGSAQIAIADDDGYREESTPDAVPDRVGDQGC